MADLKNIALTVEAAQIAEELQSKFGITVEMDVVRLGFAYAIQQEVDLAPHPGKRGGTNYATGGLDSEGLMAQTVKIYYSDPEVEDEPYRIVEILMNKGLHLIKDHLRDGAAGSLGDLIDPQSSESGHE